MTDREETIELLKKIDRHIVQHTCGYTVTQPLKTFKDYIQQALALLRKASELSAIRKEAEYYISKCSPTDYEGMKSFCVALKDTVHDAFDFIDQLQARLDRSEAENRQLKGEEPIPFG